MTNEPAQVSGELHPQAWEAFRARADEGPVVMLNLFRLKPGAEATFARWGAIMAPILERRGAQVLYAGQPTELLVSDPGGEWDRILLVQYPTRKAALDLANDADFAAAVRLRQTIVERQVLYATDPTTFGE